MAFTIAFYVHHHGSGHLMRAMQVATVLCNYKVILLGSELNNIDLRALPNVELIHLPADTEFTEKQRPTNGIQPDVFHYAPILVRGIRDRMAIIADLFKKEYPLILVVDVSVEITLFARLCGIPTIVIRQHGVRNDLPHLMAYQSAEILLAPFSKKLFIGDEDWIFNKTIFTGGFSRFSGSENHPLEIPMQIGILIGSGGSIIDSELIENIATENPEYFFHVLGNVQDAGSTYNIKWHGRLINPQIIIESCEIVIGNTGHNTIMEMASLNKRFVGIPEDRPFAEQSQKAASIGQRSGIAIIEIKNLHHAHWSVIFKKLQQEKPDWREVIDPDGVLKMANTIIETGKGLFGN